MKPEERFFTIRIFGRAFVWRCLYVKKNCCKHSSSVISYECRCFIKALDNDHFNIAELEAYCNVVCLILSFGKHICVIFYTIILLRSAVCFDIEYL